MMINNDFSYLFFFFPLVEDKRPHIFLEISIIIVVIITVSVEYMRNYVVIWLQLNGLTTDLGFF